MYITLRRKRKRNLQVMWQNVCLLERFVTEFDTITNKEVIEISSAADDFETAFWTSYVCNFKQRVSKDVYETIYVRGASPDIIFS